MLKRKENGKLGLNTFDLEMFFGELFEECDTENETEWLYDNILGCLDQIREEKDFELNIN